MQTIYNPAYRRIIGELRTARENMGITQAEAGHKLSRSRQWVQKVECFQLRLEVYWFVRMCSIYKVETGNLLRLLADEPP